MKSQALDGSKVQQLKNEDVNCRHNVWYINISVVSFYNKKVKELFEKYNIKLNVKSKLPISITKIQKYC